MTAANPAPVARGRRQLLGLAALYFVPLGAAFYLYYVGGWRPAGSTNHGELISPARPLPAASLTLIDGRAAPPDLLTGKWTLVYIGPQVCDRTCQSALINMRQTRLALAQDAVRVQRLFFAPDGCCDSAALQREHPGLVIVRAGDRDAAALLAQFPPGPVGQRAANLYIVDPLGNLMMRHDAAVRSRDLRDDLRKLLKLSRIG
ncbi:MAG: SCO family protein [Steroidobacteraceae bacterium]|nr:SCO family protein [Steroidobacteraceae bacterium]MDW8259963.1 SCO family protein [Gammaproteobacteria bacterium]